MKECAQTEVTGMLKPKLRNAILSPPEFIQIESLNLACTQD